MENERINTVGGLRNTSLVQMQTIEYGNGVAFNHSACRLLPRFIVLLNI